MVDYAELMAILSVPRPNASRAEGETARALRQWLERRGIPYQTHSFKLYPYFNEGIGVWVIVSRTLLVVAFALRWGWPVLVIAGLSLLGGILDVAMHIPVATWPGARRGENILIQFEPPQAEQEIVLAAHYDSKTELLDHTGAAFFMRKLNLGIGLTILLGLLGPLDAWLWAHGSAWAGVVFWAGIGLGAFMLFLAWGFGLNLSLGRLMEPSQGAIDNGTACAILLGLAERLSRGEIQLQRSRVTLALFAGEEVAMQGSRAFVAAREWPLPTIALNLEIMAQDGDYVIWERESNGLRRLPTADGLNQAVAGLVAEVTGRPARFIAQLMSDTFSFLDAGIPASVLGTHHSHMGGGGLHRPTDNLGRVVMPRLDEGVEILERLLARYEAGELVPEGQAAGQEN
jgi:acetylornithine deacetylase/succinyl-diaminopimelate desuccinylase-like protein